MRIMLSTCERYADDHDMRFNASKSKCIVVNPTRRNCLLYHYDRADIHFTINGDKLQFVDSYMHLGHVINSRSDDLDDISDKRAVFIGQVNNIICYFGRLSALVKQKLFNSFCTSFFGCVLWRLDHDAIGALYVAWRQAIRRIWSLPNTAHCDLLPYLCNSFPLPEEISKRVFDFINRCTTHQSALVRGIVLHGIRFAGTNSPIGYNSILLSRTSRPFVRRLYDSSQSASASFLKELVGLREGSLSFMAHSSFLSPSELSDIIVYISTH